MNNFVKDIMIFSVLAVSVLLVLSVGTIQAEAYDGRGGGSNNNASVSVPAGTSIPGCEETNECYIPYEVTIDVGGEITWSNDDTAAHTVTSGNPADGPDGLFDSSLFMAGSTFSVKFDDYEPGNYNYFCMVHPWMEGIVVVQQAGAEEMKEERHEKEDEAMKKEMMKMEKMMVGNIDITMSPPIEGSEDASVTIIEFGDFQCPKCDQWFQNEKPTIATDYIDTGKAKLYFVDFPFLGEDSDVAANASYCANDQGKYWEYHSHLYNNQGGINEGWASSDKLKQFAADIGLDIDKFNSCLDSNKHAERVSYNKQVGAEQGVKGTPVFVIIGSDATIERIEGPQSSAIFAEVIDSMLGEPVKEVMAQTIEEEESMETAAPTESEEGGGCLIATAAYGSELAPQVQYLREIRDNTLMSTTSGASFMTGFNQLYYSFSPTIADLERENPIFQEAVRVFITPMISTLSIMTLADNGSEIEVLGLGISVIALNLGMYIAAPAALGFAVSKHLKSRN